MSRGQGVHHGLHPLMVLIDGEIPLNNLAKCGIQMVDLDLAVIEELSLNRNPVLASSALPLADNVLQLNYEGAKEPGEDHDIHPALGTCLHDNFNEDVVIEGVAMESQQDLVTPACVLG